MEPLPRCSSDCILNGKALCTHLDGQGLASLFQLSHVCRHVDLIAFNHVSDEKLKKAWCSGRSEEAAEVIFERREDAIAAVRKYNNLQLDNKPMKLQLIEGTAGGAGGSRMLSSGIR